MAISISSSAKAQSYSLYFQYDHNYNEYDCAFADELIEFAIGTSYPNRRDPEGKQQVYKQLKGFRSRFWDMIEG